MPSYRHVTRCLAGLVILTATATPALAVDGCKVLLCFAGNWRDISECRPEVEQALKDQAKGKGWPTCKETQPDGSVKTDNSIVPRTVFGPSCPYWARQWTFVPEWGDITDKEVYGLWRMSCAVTEIMAVTIDGKPWKKSYLMPDGSTLDEWSPEALAAMAGVDLGPDALAAAEAAWIAAGSPTTAPNATLPPNFHNMLPGGYRACYPYSDDPAMCNLYDDAWYVPW